MLKIATHNSGSGEKSKNFLSALGKVFAQCQDKTIAEQWNFGVRYFDLRIDNEYRIVHGLWKSDKMLWDVLDELEKLARIDKINKTYYQVTIEGNYNNYKELADKVSVMQKGYLNIFCTKINKKLPKWECIYCFIKLPCATDYISVPNFKQYQTFSFNNWKRYIPIPYLLHKCYKRKYTFNEHMFTMVDFI